MPWSLSHYIALNGFDPIYQALFDHAPDDVQLEAWDNIKLYRHFTKDLSDRNNIASRATWYGRPENVTSSSAECLHLRHLFPPDRVLTEALPGDLEFFHTAPFPSMQRPFILHCECFPPIFFPVVRAEAGSVQVSDDLRKYYRSLFVNPLCQGIYSYIPETLDGLSDFFSDPMVDRKLVKSKVGLSKFSVDPSQFGPKKSLAMPTFVFTNSANQMPSHFFNRGGHVVLQFWKDLRCTGRNGRLVLRCRKPDDEALRSHGVDLAFVRHELGRSILWDEAYLTNQELNALIADAHFFLLPSTALHSASILRAMTLGTVPILTDTPGTSVFVTDRESAIVLKGVREAILQAESCNQPIDQFDQTHELVASLAKQLMVRVTEVIDSRDTYLALSHKTASRARVQFSGDSFASDFWQSVKEKANVNGSVLVPSCMAELTTSLRSCMIDRSGWSRVFESSTYPMQLLDTGASKVFEFGGATVLLSGEAAPVMNDWSVFAQYFNPGGLNAAFAESLIELGDLLLTRENSTTGRILRPLHHKLSLALMRFPTIHNLASRSLRVVRRASLFGKLWLKYQQSKLIERDARPDGELIVEDLHNFDIVRYFHKYYAIPCDEGPFVVAKLEKRMYSRTFGAYSLERVIAKINRTRMNRLQRIAKLPVLSSIIRRIGEDRVRVVLRSLMRNRTKR